MSNPDYDKAVDEMRERRRKVSEQGRKKPRSETISQPEDTPLDKAKSAGKKSGGNG